MAEVFGIVTGVIGIVSPFVAQVEQFVERYESITDNPAGVKRLASDCAELHSRLVQLQRDLSNRAGKQRAPDAVDFFRPAVEDAKRYFESAKNDLDKLQRSFPPVPTASRPARFRKVRLKCRHFALANKFARDIENISQTVDKAKLLLNPLMYELETYVTVKETLAAVKLSASACLENPQDEFKPQFLVPAMLPNIVLDFWSRDESGEPVTMEGKLKQTLLSLDNLQNDSAAVAVAVGAAGMGGVGKTSALIGLGWEAGLRNRFSQGGIYFVSVGKDASVADVIKKLGHITRSTGGIQCSKRVLESESLAGAVGEVMQWFQGRSSLFLFDDLWETAGSKVGYLPHIKQLLRSCTRSKMVLSTRSDEVALEGGEPVKFEPREPNGDQSRRILLKYAGVCTDGAVEMPRASKAALETVLRKCGGVPLTLGVAGRAIRQMTLSCSGNWTEAMVVYARDLEAEMSTVGSEDMGMYPSFEATIRTSLCVADRWSERYELRRRTGERVSCSKLFSALCVLCRRMKAPREMLKRLWRITDDRVIHDVVRKFVDLHLISEQRFSDEGSVIEVHDLILEYCQRAAGDEAPAYHAGLLNEYFPSEGDVTLDCASEANDDSRVVWQEGGTWCRAWWEFGSDAYVSEHICRHLAEGGCIGELVGLLSDFRWAEVRVRCGGLLTWHEDFNYAFSALWSWEEEVEGTREELEKIRDAAHDGWGFSANNPTELPFQMHSRLCGHVTSLMSTSYIESIERHAKRPWLRCSERCWPEPGTERSSVIFVTGAVNDVKLAKDGRMGVVACGESALIINMESRRIICSLSHEFEVRCVEVTPDGSRIISGSDDGTVRMWDGRSGEAVFEPLRGHEDSVLCMALSEDGSRIVSGSRDGTVCIWDGRSGEALCHPLRGHEGEVKCVAVSVDGNRVVSGSRDGTMCIWKGRSGKPLCKVLRAQKNGVMCVAMSEDGDRTVLGSYDGTALVWDGTSGEPVCEPLRGHKDWVGCVAVTRYGSRIVSGSHDGTVRIWDGTNGEALCEPLHGHEDWVMCLAVSMDGSRIVSGSRDGTVGIWDGNTGEAVCALLREHENRVACVAVSMDGSRVISGSSDRTVRIWDGRSREAVWKLPHAHKDRASCLAMTGYGSRIVSGSHDGTVRIWDGRSGKAVCEPLHGHEDWVMSLVVSMDESRIVSGSRDGTVCIWDGTTGEAVSKPLRGNDGSVRCLAVSTDGSRVVSGYRDGTMCIWDGRRGEALRESLPAHRNGVTCVAVSEDGSRIVSGSHDGTVRISDGTNGEAVYGLLRRHGSGVMCVAVSGNGRRFVSGSHDGTVHLLDGRSGEAVCEPLRRHECSVLYVAVSGDGNRVVSGSEDGKLRISVWNGVCFEYSVMFEGTQLHPMGEVVRVEAENGHVKYWRRDVEAGLVELDRCVWHQPRRGASSASGHAEKWEVHVSGRRVLACNGEDDDGVVLATLPFEAKHDNWGSHSFRESLDDGENGDVLGPFSVFFENNSVFSLSLVV